MVAQRWWVPLLLGLALLARAPLAADLGTLRIGVSGSGSAQWELDVIEHHGLDAAHGFDLGIQTFGSTEAARAALAGGTVDGIVDHWLWVSRRRGEGSDLVFVPHSTGAGAVMVPADSGIGDLADLEGKTIGIARGARERGWRLIRGLAEQRHGIDLAAAAEPVFGEPPELDRKMLDGTLDAVLSDWPSAARLEARGFEELIALDEVAGALGVPGEVPELGYVFEEPFADDHQALVLAFVAASKEAKALLAASDEEWQRIRPMTGAEDDAALALLKQRFREAIPESFGAAERASAAELYMILMELDGPPRAGSPRALDAGTFWSRLADY